MSCKEELKALAKTQLTDKQAMVLEAVFRGLADEDKAWFSCLLADALKSKLQWYEKAWFGALVASIIALILLLIMWRSMKK
jgi:hypothetical protein